MLSNANFGMRLSLLLCAVSVASVLRGAPGLVSNRHIAPALRVGLLRAQSNADEAVHQESGALGEAADAFLGDAASSNGKQVVVGPGSRFLRKALFGPTHKTRPTPASDSR